MPLESSATYINSFNPAWPDGADQRSTADDHIRLLKGGILRTFPSITGAISVDHNALNRTQYLASLSYSILTGGLIDTTKFTYPQTAAELAAAITPVNTYVPDHTVTGGVVYLNRYGNNTTPGTTDMTTAIANAFLVAAQAGASCIKGNDGETYAVSNTLTLAADNIVLDGNVKIKCLATSDYEFVLRASSRTGIKIKNWEFDLNQSARAGIQTHRFHGPYINSCTDCSFDNVKVKNTLGYSGISAVGIAIGQGTRCKVENCTVLDCGTSSNTSDGIYTSGTQNLISNCTATNCTDTAFVVEDSDFSGVSGCSAYNCASPAAITLSLSTDRRGNYIDGLTSYNWDASSTGGVAIATLASTGTLYDTTVNGFTSYADTGSGFGSGAAIWIRRVGTGNIIGVTIDGCNIDGADYAVRVNDGQDICISDVRAKNIASSAFLFLAGGTHFLNDCHVNGAGVGVDAQGTGTTVYAKSCSVTATTSAGAQALNTSVLSLTDTEIFSISGGVRTAKDAGAFLNFGQSVKNLVKNAGATYTVLETDTTIIQNTAASVYTLPSASAYVGRILNIKTEFAGTITSASSNVVPLVGGAAGTAILAATAGKWAMLQSDGVAWIIIAAN